MDDFTRKARLDEERKPFGPTAYLFAVIILFHVLVTVFS